MAFDPVLELKLGILHELLTVEGAQEAISKPEYGQLLAEVHEEKPLKHYVEDLIAVGDDIFSKDYIAKLTKIRIFLLGE